MTEQSEPSTPPNSHRAPEDQTIGYYTDSTLIHRWMAAELIAARGGKTRWAKVRDTFLVGSTTAREICNRHGFDPEQKVKP